MTSNEDQESTDNRADELDKKLSTTGWGVLLLWVGVASISNLSIGIVLLGTGVIVLAMQYLRKFLGMRMEGFWIIIGLLFTFGGLAGLYDVDLPVLSVVLVLAGILLLVSAHKRNQ